MEAEEVMLGRSDPRHRLGFRAMADCLPQMVGTCDATGGCDFLNRHWLTYTGLPANQQLGMNWLRQVHPDDQSHVAQLWRGLATGTEVLRLEFRIRRHDGVYRRFEAHVTPLPNTAERTWVFGLVDIHDRKASIREPHLRGVFDSAPVSITLEDWSLVLRELQLLRDTGIDDYQLYFDAHPELVDRLLDSIQVVEANGWSALIFAAKSREQLVGSSLRWLFASPAARAGFVRMLVRLARGEQSPAGTFETCVCAYDGSSRRVLTNAVPHSRETQPGMVLVSRVDVSELHLVNEELHRQQMLLRRVSSLAKVGGYLLDVASRTILWSDEVATIFGLERGKKFSFADTLAVYAPADRLRLEAAFQRTLDHAEPFELELPMITATRRSKWIRTSAFPALEDDRVIRVEVAIQDVTDRKRAELETLTLNASLESQVVERTRQMEQARHDLQVILDALPIMVVCWDTNLRLRFANRAFTRDYRHIGRNLQGLHISEVLDKEVLEACLPRIHQSLDGEAQRVEALLTTPDGTRNFCAEIHYQPAILDGLVRASITLVIDVTSLKQAEQGLRAANRELEAFAYAVAHDLRAPLRAMRGFSCALLEDHAALLGLEAHGFLFEINKAGERMGELLDGLLTLSRSTQGVLQRDRVDLSAMAASLLEEFHDQEPARQVRWLIAPGLIVFGDVRMLESMMRNLLGNAWKYSANTAHAQICFDAVFRGGVRCFRISDNGVGFDMQHADRLFKPFQRLHRQEEFPGIGIGLATVKRIVNRHGGELNAHAAPGRGAEFIFSLGEQFKSHDA